MKPIKTLYELNVVIEKDYAWRIKELSNYRNAVLEVEGKKLNPMIRGGVALLYAHWEGFIKNTGDNYYSFVISQATPLKDLNNSFISIALRGALDELVSTKKISIHTKVVEKFFDESHKKPYFSKTSPIRTSNLKYEIFEDICLMIGLDINEFHERYRNKGYDRELSLYINESLLDKRNNIAHGNYLPVDIVEYRELYDVVVNGLLYVFKELVMDAAQAKKYLK